MRRLACALAAALLAAVGAGTARAAEVSSERLRELARRAADDQAALAELRRVDAVDGRRADVGRLLAGATGDELEGRLRVLAQAPGGTAGLRAPEARRAAREILGERRFREPARLRPFRRPLEALRDVLRSALGPVVSRLGDRVPGGDATVWTVLALAVVAAAAWLGSRAVRRRTAEAVERTRALAAGAIDPRRLERDADEAERRGDLERALRLRFRAGLLRLQRADAIPARESLTSGEVARRLGSADFDRVAATFDEVVYGGRPPERVDLESSRAGWARVLEAVGAR